jgi:SAM-dependent methyltransferase
VSRLTGLTRIPLLYQVAQRVLTDPTLTEKVLREGIRYTPGQRVLDVGCGPGLFSGLFDDADYLGIDLSSEYIERARAIYPGKRFEVLDATKVGSLGLTFDRMLVCGMFHHMPDDDVKAALQGMRKLLAPNGHCFVAEAMWPQKRRDVAGWFLRKLDHGQHVRTYAEWVRLFQPFGLRSPGTYYNKLLPCMTCRLDLGPASSDAGG